MKKQLFTTFLLFVLILLFLTFIWGNSLADGELSNSISKSVSSALQPVFNPDGKLSTKKFDALVRKVAHGFEFGCLGAILMGVTILYARKKGHSVLSYVGTPLFVALAVAVTDEFIQSFTGRTSAVKDVLLDFSGSVTGILLVGGIYGWVHVVRRRQA